MAPHFEFEAELGEGARVAGVDEAGRGPLAGPVLAAAVVFPRRRAARARRAAR
jgi:ribonuclease HIII